MSEDNSQYDGRKALITGITGQDGRYAREKTQGFSLPAATSPDPPRR